MKKPEITAFTFSVEGKEYEANLLSKKEIEKERKFLENQGINVDECSCGEWFCTSNGYYWHCALHSDNVCRWFGSNWRCNP